VACTTHVYGLLLGTSLYFLVRTGVVSGRRVAGGVFRLLSWCRMHAWRLRDSARGAIGAERILEIAVENPVRFHMLSLRFF